MSKNISILCNKCEQKTLEFEKSEYLNMKDKAARSVCMECCLIEYSNKPIIKKKIPDYLALWQCICCGQYSRSHHMRTDLFEYDVCMKCYINTKNVVPAVVVVPDVVVVPAKKIEVSLLEKFHNSEISEPVHAIDVFEITQSVKMLMNNSFNLNIITKN
jgi:hypothetical protein